MHIQKILVTMMVIVLITTACTPTKGLNETSWILTALDNKPVVNDTLVTIKFEKGMTTGGDGCNSYSTTFIQKGHKITISPNIASTMMACPEAIMQQAATYTTMLTQVATYKIDDQQLALLDANGKTLATFTK